MTDSPFVRLTTQWPDLAIAQAQRIHSPAEARQWLAGLAVDEQPLLRSPLTVLRDREATPLDGALWAAAVLRGQGHLPRLLVLLGQEGLHAAALVEIDGRWQAVAHHSQPELRMDDEQFVSIEALAGELAERIGGEDVQWCIVALENFDAHDWMGDDAQVGALLAAIDEALTSDGDEEV